MKNIDIRQIIQIFLHVTVREIKRESIVPNINFKFSSESIPLFKDIVANPFVEKEGWTSSTKASLDDIDFLMHFDEGAITVNINDSYKFFQLLQQITNALLKLRKKYTIGTNPPSVAADMMENIWLRMGINDINNIELFLEKQLQFANNITFDTPNNVLKKVDIPFDYDVFMTTAINKMSDESTRSMIFVIKNNEKTYELPRILYDIDDKGICYIYGVQNDNSKPKDKSIGRKLYKINKNIMNPNIHPSKVYAMLFFVSELKKKKISKIIVPSMQVLNYRYHEILGKILKEQLKKYTMKLNKYPDHEPYIEEYQYTKNLYDRVYERQDEISYAKTEELIYLIYRITEHDPDIEITNEINIQGDSLNVKIN